MKSPAPQSLNPEAVTARAEQLWRIAGSPSGRDLEFWLAAEAELRLDKDRTRTAATDKPRLRKKA